jgi:hypothetical protein
MYPAVKKINRISRRNFPVEHDLLMVISSYSLYYSWNTADLVLKRN